MPTSAAKSRHCIASKFAYANTALLLNYYIATQRTPLHTQVILEAQKLGTDTDDNWWKKWDRSLHTIDCVQALVQSMESNLSFDGVEGFVEGFSWDAATATLCRRAGLAGTTKLQLCDDVKAQFITEFKRLLLIFSTMNDKMNICLAMRRRWMDEDQARNL